MTNNDHVVVLVVGKTAAGKSELIKKVCERTGWKQLVSNTTRPRRSENDTDHYFVTDDDYLLAKANGEVVAETEIAGYHYYATKEQLYGADFYTINPAAIDDLLALDIPGIRFVTVYISCPDDIRERRALDIRQDSKQTFRKRCFDENAQFRKFVSEEKWDYSIKNIDFAKAYSCLRYIATIEGVWKNHEKVEDYNNDSCV